MDSLITFITHMGSTVTSVIDAMGYAGVFFWMILESMVFPVPSELIMPFAGFLVTQGKMSFALVIVASAGGSLVGSLLSYYIGKLGGEPLIRRYGRFFLVDTADLEKTEHWFKTKGEKTIFISRFIPVVRHFISIPAGMGKMALPRFCLYTVVGAAIWNGILAYTGVLLGIHWELVHAYLKPISFFVAGVLLICGGYFIYKHLKKP